MKVLHVIPSLSPTEGGPSRALPLVAESLHERGIEVVTATTDDAGKGRRDPELSSSPVETPHGIRHHFPKQTDFYKVSLPLANWLGNHVREYDVVHIHALFSFSSITAARIARKAGVPYVIRPLGVLTQYGIRNRRRFLKQLSLRLQEGPLLRAAAAVHFTSEQEQQEAGQLGFPLKGEVIPLGLSFPSPSGSAEASDSPYALYLSRLDPKKNLESLLHAWAGVSGEASAGWSLRIAGDGDPAYVQSLRELSSGLGLDDRVEWLGHIDGEEKADLLQRASLYILPSFSENFGIAPVEAMGAGVPCLLTTGVAVGREAGDAGSCFLTDTDPESITSMLKKILGDGEGRHRMGRKGREFARERYGLERMGRSLESLYRRITNRTPDAE